MNATSVYIAREQFLRHQTVERTQARSKDFHIRVVRVLLHTRVLMKFKLSCTVGTFNIAINAILKYNYNCLYNDHCVPCMNVK